MPTNTFERLPAEKKKRLIHAALEEFSERSYADSSINHIVQSAHIPRGSFYQYFEDKEDLFLYLLESLEKKPRKLLSHLLRTCQGDLPRALVLLFDIWFLQYTVPTFSDFQAFNILKLNPMLDWQLQRSDLDQPLLSRGRRNPQDPPARTPEDQYALLLCFFSNICKKVFFHPEDTLLFRQELIHTVDFIFRANTVSNGSH